MKNYKSGARFEDTNWEFIESLKAVPFRELSSETYNEFIEIYKDPMYSFLRFSGYSQQDSEDLVQDLFVKLLETNLIQEVSQEKGKLRSYLIGVLKRVISKKHRHSNAYKRGGGVEHQTLDESLNLTDSMYSPDEVFDQAWSKTMILRAQEKLFENQPQLTKEQKSLMSELLNWNAEGVNYKEASVVIGTTVAALKTKIFRLRIQFKELLYKEVASTLVDPSLESIERELAVLRSSWQKNK